MQEALRPIEPVDNASVNFISRHSSVLQCSRSICEGFRAADALLTPVFLIQNFTRTCHINDQAFLSELFHGASMVDELSDQTKLEITEGLTDDEAKTVVLVAANTALKAARDEMRKLSPDYPKNRSATAFSMVQ